MYGANEYALDAYAAIKEQNNNVYYDEFMSYMNEINILAEGFTMGKILLEDVTVDNSKTGRSTLGTIIDFIKRIIAKFIDTAKSLFQTNEKWFSANAAKFDTIDDDKYAAMKITLIPYWKANEYNLPKPSIQANDNRLGGDNMKDLKDIEKAMYPSIMKLSVSDNIVEGAKIFFRGGSNNMVIITGGDVKGRVKGMIKYCNTYVTIANNIKDRLEELQKSIEDASENLDKAMEDFSIAEGMPLMETVYASLPWVDGNGNVVYLAEARNRNNGNGSVSTTSGNNSDGNNNNANSGDSGAAPQGNGSVTTGNENGNGNGNNGNNNEMSEEDKKKKDADIGNKTAIKSFYQTQLKVGTAMMTVAEERYCAYVRTLKGVLSAAGTTTIEKKDQNQK